jgi:hypothetical protein
MAIQNIKKHLNFITHSIFGYIYTALKRVLCILLAGFYYFYCTYLCTTTTAAAGVSGGY